MNKETQAVRIVTKDIVGTSSDNHTRTFFRQVTDRIALIQEQTVVRQHIGIRREQPHIRIAHRKSIRQTTGSLLVRFLEKLLAQSAFLRGKRHQFLVIIADAQLFCQLLSYLATTAAKLPADGQYDFIIHVYLCFWYQDKGK